VRSVIVTSYSRANADGAKARAETAATVAVQMSLRVLFTIVLSESPVSAPTLGGGYYGFLTA
jgi:hypothetical protein